MVSHITVTDNSSSPMHLVPCLTLSVNKTVTRDQRVSVSLHGNKLSGLGPTEGVVDLEPD